MSFRRIAICCGCRAGPIIDDTTDEANCQLATNLGSSRWVRTLRGAKKALPAVIPRESLSRSILSVDNRRGNHRLPAYIFATQTIGALKPRKTAKSVTAPDKNDVRAPQAARVDVADHMRSRYDDQIVAASLYYPSSHGRNASQMVDPSQDCD